MALFTAGCRLVVRYNVTNNVTEGGCGAQVIGYGVAGVVQVVQGEKPRVCIAYPEQLLQRSRADNLTLLQAG